MTLRRLKWSRWQVGAPDPGRNRFEPVVECHPCCRAYAEGGGSGEGSGEIPGKLCQGSRLSAGSLRHGRDLGTFVLFFHLFRCLTQPPPSLAPRQSGSHGRNQSRELTHHHEGISLLFCCELLSLFAEDKLAVQTQLKVGKNTLEYDNGPSSWRLSSFCPFSLICGGSNSHDGSMLEREEATRAKRRPTSGSSRSSSSSCSSTLGAAAAFGRGAFFSGFSFSFSFSFGA